MMRVADRTTANRVAISPTNTPPSSVASWVAATSEPCLFSKWHAVAIVTDRELRQHKGLAAKAVG